MKILEYKAKEIFRNAGIPTPTGYLVRSVPDVAKSMRELGISSAVLKAQIPAGGRGKAGGISFVQSIDEAMKTSAKMLGSRVKGYSVDKLLLEEKLDIDKELYVGITISGIEAKPIVLACTEGGVEIEEVARNYPQEIIYRYINFFPGLTEYKAREIAREMGFSGKPMLEIGDIIRKLYQVFRENDAFLAEINPLVLTQSGEPVAADARLDVDDDALYRHPETRPEAMDALTEIEKEAMEKDPRLRYVELDGNIASLVNGAGLGMATLDSIYRHGGHPASFLNRSPMTDSVERVSSLLRILFADPKVKVLLVNIFGGIARCDVVASGIVDVIRKDEPSVPLVVRLVGTNEMEGRRVLRNIGINPFRSMEEAVKKAVELAEAN